MNSMTYCILPLRNIVQKYALKTSIPNKSSIQKILMLKITGRRRIKLNREIRAYAILVFPTTETEEIRNRHFFSMLKKWYYITCIIVTLVLMLKFGSRYDPIISYFFTIFFFEYSETGDTDTKAEDNRGCICIILTR